MADAKEWGARFNFPENLQVEQGNYCGSISNEIAVKMAERYDDFIVHQIAMEARAELQATDNEKINDVIERWEDGFLSIAFYNGYEEWLWEIADEMVKRKEPYFHNPIPCEMWHTDKHALWMMLVALFGDWGTSIRSGWIERMEEAAEFINRVTDRQSAEQEG